MRLVLYPRLRQTLDMLEDFLFIFSHTKHDIIIIILLKNCISERMGRNLEEMKRERTIRKHDAKRFATNYSSGFLGLFLFSDSLTTVLPFSLVLYMILF